jgi:hypothetical protein
VFRVLLVAVFVFSLSVAVKANPEPAGAGVAACSDLCERRDRLHAEIARLHAETALVEAELVLFCTERTNQTDVGMHPLLALPSQSPSGERGMQEPTDESQQTHLGGTAPFFVLAAPAEEVAGTEQNIMLRVDQTPPARRTGGNPLLYAVHCWAASSAFVNPSCNCLGQAMHPKLASRPTIKVIVGSWYRARGRTCTSERQGPTT